jgi:hypothetical protein
MRTDLPNRPRATNYIGTDPERPQLCARVYLSESNPGERPWFWTLADEDRGIGTGYVATARAAVAAAERAYAAWRDSKPAS